MDENNFKFYKLSFLPSGVHLIVDHSKINDIETAYNIIVKEVEEKQIEKVDFEYIKKTLQNPTITDEVIAPPQPEPTDGFVEAKFSDDENTVLIHVTPPRGKGKPVTVEMALEAIKSIGAGNFFLYTDKIEDIINNIRTREYTTVGERRDGSFTIDITKDHLSAILTVKPPFGGKEVSLEEILQHLKNEHITQNLNIRLIKEIIEKKKYNTSIPIAEGRKPIAGKDAELEFYFEHKKKKLKPKIDEEGNVDFYELGIIENVRKGDKLAKKIPATPGIPGVDIYGNEIPAKGGKDIPSLIGPGTTFSPEDPTLIIASTDGQPKFINNKICVLPVFEVQGDVDFSIGNINFVGNVLVRGNVLSGFKIKAVGDIQIFGNVEASYLEAGGSITIKRGIVGQDKAIINCRGDLFARFIHNANVYCEGSVYVEEEILYSKVNGFLDVIVGGKGGTIVGGIVRATRTVSAKKIGTLFPVVTKIEVGGSPSLREELDEIERELLFMENQSQLLEHSIETAKKMSKEDPSKKNNVLLATKEHFSLLEKIRKYREKKEDLENKIRAGIGTPPKVHALQKVFAGVQITIKDSTRIINDEIECVTFYEQEGEIKIAPFENKQVS